MITKIRRNLMGTISFSAMFENMRKEQEFIVYPMKPGDTQIMIQSDTRIGLIELATGAVRLAGPHAGGAYGVHLAFAKDLAPLSGEDLLRLKAHIQGTAGGHVGNNDLVYVDNSGARDVMSIGAAT